ncbi:MAG: glycosyltransferase family 9 protein [Deltaproteobacteria bacterium]|nr:glycosyltransferase family 9 protein [Deltaproteobacteria bacterium]
MRSSARPKIILVKLAGIGDVAMACRALNDFLSERSAPIDLHWIIDANLISLAQELLNLPADVTLKFHAVDTKRLFQGTALEKAFQTARMAAAAARVRPGRVVLLHRDWRYRALLRPVFPGKIISLARDPINEVFAYRAALEKLGAGLNFEPRAKKNPKATTGRAATGRIGILVGGAKSTKLVYREKRWPWLAELLALILKDSRKTAVLYGGAEDAETADALIRGATERKLNASRIENLTGKLKLHELPESLAALDAFISIDSGLIHIAATVMTREGQKVLGLYGPTDPVVWGPTASGEAEVRLFSRSVPCSPCYRNDGRFRPCLYSGEMFQHCMKEITPEEVVKAALEG